MITLADCAGFPPILGNLPETRLGCHYQARNSHRRNYGGRIAVRVYAAGKQRTIATLPGECIREAMYLRDMARYFFWSWKRGEPHESAFNFSVCEAMSACANQPNITAKFELLLRNVENSSGTPTKNVAP